MWVVSLLFPFRSRAGRVPALAPLQGGGGNIGSRSESMCTNAFFSLYVWICVSSAGVVLSPLQETGGRRGWEEKRGKWEEERKEGAGK